jgi:hypothetical protein
MENATRFLGCIELLLLPLQGAATRSESRAGAVAAIVVFAAVDAGFVVM